MLYLVHRANRVETCVTLSKSQVEYRTKLFFVLDVVRANADRNACDCFKEWKYFCCCIFVVRCNVSTKILLINHAETAQKPSSFF